MHSCIQSFYQLLRIAVILVCPPPLPFFSFATFWVCQWAVVDRQPATHSKWLHSWLSQVTFDYTFFWLSYGFVNSSIKSICTLDVPFRDFSPRLLPSFLWILKFDWCFWGMKSTPWILRVQMYVVTSSNNSRVCQITRIQSPSSSHLLLRMVRWHDGKCMYFCSPRWFGVSGSSLGTYACPLDFPVYILAFWGMNATPTNILSFVGAWQTIFLHCWAPGLLHCLYVYYIYFCNTETTL